MSVSIIVPCYILPDKNAELFTFTQNCITSIRKHMPYAEIVIVDNGSPVFEKELESMCDVYFRFGENKGFSKAVNKGFELATSNWLVVCNNDVEFLDDWFHFVAKEWRISETGIFCSHLHAHDPKHKARTVNTNVGHFFGALWMIHRSIYDGLGGLDESYEYGYYEDKDFAQKILKAGYKIRKGGWCKHIGNATSGKMQNMNEFFFKNKAIYDKRWKS